MILGKATISNDGATIINLLDVVHPAAKTLVDIAKSQDAEVLYYSFIEEKTLKLLWKMSNSYEKQEPRTLHMNTI